MCVATVLAAFILVVAPTLGQPLLKRHAFRQTQTAYTARIYHEQGMDIVHPKLPVLGEPFEVPFEFPLFQAAASLVMDAGVRDDVAMRSTGLVCFLLTALLLYGLVRHVAGRVSALAALVAFVATPFALVWGRSSMIEYLATAGAVGYAWALIAWRENRRPAVGGLALLAGLVGMLVKPTTAVFWLLPALGYRPSRPGPAQQRRGSLLVLALLILVPLAAAIVWTRHADAIKGASPLTAWLTSDALREWNFGSLAQRFDPGVWGTVAARIELHILGVTGAAFLLVAVVALTRSSQRAFWLGVWLAAALPLLVFTNLYLQHDYYLAAIAPALAALIGLGFGFLWRIVSHLRSLRACLIAVALLSISLTFVVDRDYWHAIYVDEPDAGLLALAREVSSTTEESDRVGVVGLDWSPSLLYYAHRWGLMVTGPANNQSDSYDALRADGYRHLVVADPADADLAPLARWPWVGALGPHSYALADTAEGLRPSRFVGTDEIDAMQPNGRTLRRGARVVCGSPTSVPAGRLGTEIRIRNQSPRGRVSVSDALAPLPARRALFVGRELGRDGSLTVTCSGRRALLIDVLDAPLPTSR
jgi:hypothetical protein